MVSVLSFQRSEQARVFWVAASHKPLSVAVDVPTMTDLERNDASIIMNLIKDAVGPLADSVALSVGEFLGVEGSGLASQH